MTDGRCPSKPKLLFGRGALEPVHSSGRSTSAHIMPGMKQAATGRVQRPVRLQLRTIQDAGQVVRKVPLADIGCSLQAYRRINARIPLADMARAKVGSDGSSGAKVHGAASCSRAQKGI